MKNLIISMWIWSENWDKLLEFIANEMEKNLNYSLRTVCKSWQSEVRYQREEVQEFQFEWVLSLNSTVGRIMIVNYLESFISHPNIVRQKFCENVLFSIESNASYKSKYCNDNIDFILLYIWELYKVTIKYNGDETFFLRRQIKSLVLKHKSILYWRVLVEREILWQQGKIKYDNNF